MKNFCIGFGLLLGLTGLAAEDIKLKDVSSDQNTSITVEKGDIKNCTEYEVIEGKDEIAGAPEFDRTKAYSGWKSACAEWKQNMKEMNKANSLLTLNCETPSPEKADNMLTYKSHGTYKVKVLIREKKRP